MGKSLPSSRASQRRGLLAPIVAAAVIALAVPLVTATPAMAAPPSAPVLIAPADGSVSSVPDPQLSVAVSDPEGDPLTVTFEGRTKGATVPGPTTGTPFTLVVVPDIQNYTIASRAAIIAQQTQWIVDNRAGLNTQFVVQVGDIVNEWNNPSQWTFASNGLKVLNDNGVPNAVVPGNHDFDNATGAHAAYDTWFPPSRFQNASWTPSTASYGGYMGADQFGTDAEDRGNMNNYSLFTAGGVDWLVLGLEWEAPRNVLDWADRVLAAHPDRQVIMFTHSFLDVTGARRAVAQRPGGTPPETTWQTFVRTHCQVRLVVSGHEHSGDLGESRRTDDNMCGRPVHQILSDYQERTNGGSGWLRYYRFDPAAGTMTASTYSPYLRQFETDADSSFALPFPLAPAVPAPFATIATVPAASGSTATATWPGLARDAEYEWRVRVNDGTDSTTSPTWTIRVPDAPGVLARDHFERSVTSGWGSADKGGSWSVTAASSFSVAGGAGSISLATSLGQQANLNAVSTTNVRVGTSVSVDKIANAQYISVIGRQVGAEQYLLRLRVGGGGDATLLTMRGGTAIGANYVVPGLTIVPGASYNLAFEVTGTSPTRLSAKMWAASGAEPAAWQVTRTDTTAVLQAAGSVGLFSYVPSAANAYPLKLSFGEFIVTDPTVAVGPNQVPVAVFTSGAAGLVGSFDGSGSSDPDGTVVSYAWEFGDGGTAAVAKPSHTFAAAGTYSVKLTVTDNQGDTGTVTHDVTVSAPANQVPVAVFTSGAAGLVGSFDGSGSSDPDGTVVSYAWEFGDGGTAAVARPSHTFAAAGTYSVKLTVTDNQGGTGTVTKSVTVSAPPAGGGLLAQDLFERSVASGWGNADTGGAWTFTTTPSRFSVAGGTGVVTLANSTGLQANLNAVSTTNVRVGTSVSVDKIANAQYISVIGRQVGAEQYLLRLRVGGGGDATLLTMRGGTAIGANYVVPGLTIVPGASYNLAFEVTGTSPTRLSAKMWAASGAEPAAWQVTRTDTTAVLQAAGSVGLFSYVPSAANAYPLKLSFGEFIVTDPTVAVGPNQVPVAVFTSGAAGLVGSFDGSGSSDPDGTVVSYAWEFGDGGTAAVAKPSHTFAAAGTYSVKLTVTDNQGDTGTVTHDVTVSAPANQVPVAVFTSGAAGLVGSFDGSGSSDPDGTVVSYAWEFGDGGTAAVARPSHTFAAAGTYSVKLTVTDNQGGTGTVTKSVTVSAPPAGGGLLAQDLFERSVASGWGNADTGGAWTFTTTPSRFSVAGGTGVVTLANSTGLQANLNAVSSSSTRVTATFSVDKIANAQYISVIGRQVGAEQYLVRVRVASDGSVILHVMRGGTAIGAAYSVPGLTIVPGALYGVMFEVTGMSPTVLSAKIWRSGTAEPAAWQVTRADAAAVLQAPGSVGIYSYVPTAANAFPVRLSFSDVTVTDPAAAP